MKKYMYLLLMFLIAGASLHTMEMRVEPFNYALHGDSAASTFEQSFPGIAVPEILLGKPPTDNKHARVIVSHDTPTQARGVVIYETITKHSYSAILNDLFTRRSLKQQVADNLAYHETIQKIADEKPRIISIDYIGVHPDDQGKKYGRALLDDIEQQAGDFVVAAATSNSIDFYKHLGYTQTNPIKRSQMTKPLNHHVETILKMVRDVRFAAWGTDELISI